MPGKKRGVDSVAVQNAAKTLAANIRFASVDNPVSSIVVTSSIPGEGKTFVAIELAKALAASGKRVLIMECDMRKRSLAARLGRHGLHGIYDVLSGEADITEAVTPTGTENLWFLDAEPNIPNPTDIVSSKRFRGLLQGLRREFGYVVMDTPPLGAFVDAAVLGSVADATVLVVRQNFVRRDDMSRPSRSSSRRTPTSSAPSSTTARTTVWATTATTAATPRSPPRPPPPAPPGPRRTCPSCRPAPP